MKTRADKIKPITSAYVKKNLPRRTKTSSKIDGGKVLIIGGGKDYLGAGILAALAATKTGAGYTHLMTDLKKYPWLKFPDFILHAFSAKALGTLQDHVIGVGPGMGMTAPKKKILATLIKKKFPKVIVDGDALTMLSKMPASTLPATWILTPHEGELARLLGTTSLEVKANRVQALKRAQLRYGCIVILKGADTLIADTKNIYLVNSGTVALAKAGTGDVLVGVISALYAQDLSPVIAAIVGCYIHGQASQLWLKDKNDILSMRPVDLIEKIPNAIFKLRA